METRCKIKYGEGWQTDWRLIIDSYNPNTGRVTVTRMAKREDGPPVIERKELFADRVEYREDDGEWINCDPEENVDVDSDEQLTDDEREEYRLAQVERVLEVIKCRVCGREVPRSGGRGRPRLVHEECRNGS